MTNFYPYGDVYLIYLVKVPLLGPKYGLSSDKSDDPVTKSSPLSRT